MRSRFCGVLRFLATFLIFCARGVRGRARVNTHMARHEVRRGTPQLSCNANALGALFCGFFVSGAGQNEHKHQCDPAQRVLFT